MNELRSLVKGELFDYQMLMYCLREYKKPRDKITLLLREEAIIQLKRGLYLFGPSFRRGVLSVELAAAMLVQPSYISKEYALRLYGLMTERVEIITSMTTRKKRRFDTPIGRFDYFSLSQEKFGVGVEVREIPQEGGYLCATKEKALADWIASVPPIQDREALQFFLYEESRMDEAALLPLNHFLLEEISLVYHNRNIDLLLTL